MPASVLDNILNAVVTQVTQLNLMEGSSSVSVSLRKLPRVEQDLDTLPLIAVNKAERPEPLKPLAFQGPGKQAFIQKTYLVDITVIAAGNQDFSADNIDVYAAWRETLINAFRPDSWGSPILGVAQVWDIDITPDAFLDRRQLNQSYDYQCIRLGVKTEE